jgi:diguanylate cyclase (GGDEF)-like protein/PAS domain S-box-containing protein
MTVRTAHNKNGTTDTARQDPCTVHTYQSLIEHCRDAAFTVSPEGVVTWLNRAFEKATDWSRVECIGRPITEFLQLDLGLPAHAGGETEGDTDALSWRTGTLRLRSGKERSVEVCLTRERPAGAIVGLVRLEPAAEGNGNGAFLQEVIDGIPDPIVVMDLGHRVRLRNRSAREAFPNIGAWGALCCYDAPRGRKNPCAALLRPCPVERAQREGHAVTFILEHKSAAGESSYSEIRISPLRDTHGEIQAIVQSARDITRRIAAESKLWESQLHLDHLVHHDSLTGLSNRLLFQDRLEHAIIEAQREGHMVGLLFLDLDRFKIINDNLGHEFGDRLLRVVAKRLCQCVRESDTVARLGGDEFTVILARLKDSFDAVVVAQKIIAALSRPIKLENHKLQVGVSIGISLYPSDSEDAEVLVKHADEAMYLAKEKGRRQYQFYTEELNVRAVRRRTMEAALLKAVRRGQLDLYFRPRLQPGSGRLVGLQACVYWEHPTLGSVAPEEFMAIAEDSGIVTALGEWALKTACVRIQELQSAEGLRVPVAVRLSAREFQSSALVERVARVLEETGVDPALLQLEVPEWVLAEDPELAAASLGRLRNHGARLGVAGFSGGRLVLTDLAALPLDAVVLDSAMLRQAEEAERSAIALRGLIRLAHELGLAVVAPGVQTDEQTALLRHSQCDAIEGPLISGPLPVSGLAPFLGHQLDRGATASR